MQSLPSSSRVGTAVWTLTKCMEKKLDGNYARMLRAILNKSRRLHPTKQQLCENLLSITKTIKVTRSRHVGHCMRSRNELISNMLLWIYSHGRAKAGRPARIYIQQLCADTDCNLEDLQEVMRGGERGLGISVLMAWRNDDDDDYYMINLYPGK